MKLLEPFETAIGWLLAVFYSVVPNLGVAIILLTCVVMAALLPLTAKQTRSMIAMQRVQPEIKKIQAQYKDDRQKQNEALMQFYKENNVNPLSGCLPLIVQAPVMFALFRVLRERAGPHPDDGYLQRPLQGSLRQRVVRRRVRRPQAHDVPRLGPHGHAGELRQRDEQHPRAPPLLPRRGCGRRERLVPDVADPVAAETPGLEPEQPDEQADADDQPGVPDPVRLVLLDRVVQAWCCTS